MITLGNPTLKQRHRVSFNNPCHRLTNGVTRVYEILWSFYIRGWIKKPALVMENLIVIELSFWSSNWGSDNQKFKTLTMINRAQILLSSMTPSSLADNMCARAWTDIMQVGEDLSWIDQTWKVDLSPGENPRGSGMLLRVASQFSPGKTSPLTLYLQGSGNTKTKNSRSYLLCKNCKAKALGIECYDLCRHDSAPSDAPASWFAKSARL